MKSSQLQKNVSAYLFAMAITLILCGFAAGILYIDRSANQTITSAGGLIYPIEEKLMALVEGMFDL